MGRSERTEKENKMTIYFDKRADEERSCRRGRTKEKKRKHTKQLQESVAIFVKPLLLMLLWNWLMPGLFGLATINYLKAFGLWMIARLIFDKE